MHLHMAFYSPKTPLSKHNLSIIMTSMDHSLYWVFSLVGCLWSSFDSPTHIRPPYTDSSIKERFIWHQNCRHLLLVMKWKQINYCDWSCDLSCDWSCDWSCDRSCDWSCDVIMWLVMWLVMWLIMWSSQKEFVIVQNSLNDSTNIESFWKSSSKILAANKSLYHFENTTRATNSSGPSIRRWPHFSQIAAETCEVGVFSREKYCNSL